MANALVVLLTKQKRPEGPDEAAARSNWRGKSPAVPPVLPGDPNPTADFWPKHINPEVPCLGL